MPPQLGPWRLDGPLTDRACCLANLMASGWASLRAASVTHTHVAVYCRTGASNAARLSLERRAAIACLTSHRALPKLVDCQLESTQPYVIYRAVKGQSLPNWLAAQAMTPQTLALLSIGRMALEGLDALHRAGYVHTQVRPEHVLIAADARVQLVGLGNCRLVGDIVSREPPWDAYSSPEMQRCGYEASSAQDIYAVGQILQGVLGAAFTHSPLGKAVLATDPSQRPVAGELVAILLELEALLAARGGAAARSNLAA